MSVVMSGAVSTIAPVPTTPPPAEGVVLSEEVVFVEASQMVVAASAGSSASHLWPSPEGLFGGVGDGPGHGPCVIPSNP